MNRLKSIRQTKGITQNSLAEKSGISLMTIKAYEQNKRDLDGANIKTLLIISKVLGVKLIELITDKEIKEMLANN